MDVRRRQPMGVELVKRGIVNEEAIEEALTYQREHPNQKIGDILYILGLAEPKTLIEAIGEILGTKGILLNSESIKINLTDYISLDIAQKNKAVPFEVSSGKIKVCFANTVNNRAMETIRMLFLNKGLVMESYVTFENDIEKYLRSLEGEAGKAGIEVADQGGTITSLVDSIIKTGMVKRASDIHIEPLENEVRVRYRIDGELVTAATIDKEKQTQIIGRLKAISNMHQEKQESQDGRILLYDDYNIRVSSQPNVYGEKFVLRLLKKNADIKQIFDLGFPGDEKTLNKSVNKRNSITIIAAPTGEGKTTTLYSIIDYLNRPEINITTIEDPVEIRIPGLNQIEIDKKSTFSSALRTVLRQDPDVILVGEIRDRETAEIAIQAGQTGHYVLSTIHTIDSIEVINRLRKIGVSDYDIASTLATSISQRLVRRLCHECRREREFTEEEKQIITNISNKYGMNVDLSNIKTYDAIGCKHCNNTGYYDRIGVFEVLDLDDEIKELIVKGASSIEIRNKALEKNYRPLAVDGIKKVLMGITTLEELNNKLLIF
ncbi:type II secretion system protein E [Clostridium sp. CAG:440]|jgi:type IV pilus assembly protein PilB|nr:type II secretion system protein E [Clostridium sp. CAG:440]HJJ15789.1 ATPase, T2SS/T4P/T4SS family [Clostridiaceae bacterium]